MASDPRSFELRTYVATPGRLADLQARFRDHTTALFEKRGMTNVGYWVAVDENNEPTETLVYMLAHASRQAAKDSWAAFYTDPDWIAAKAASEVNGPLTTSVSSVFLTPTDFSALS